MGAGRLAGQRKTGLERRGARGAQARHAVSRLYRSGGDAEGADRRAPRRERESAASGPGNRRPYARAHATSRARKTKLNLHAAGDAGGGAVRPVCADGSGSATAVFRALPTATITPTASISRYIIPISAFDKIRLEAPYHALTNAGHISYIEMDGDPTKNLDAFEAVVRCDARRGHRLRFDQSSG